MLDTRMFWNLLQQGKHEVFLSDITLSEISACNEQKLNLLLDYLSQIQYQVIHITEDTVELAEKFIHFGILKQKSFDDCQHISAAIIAGCDIITSWNFKHIVNVKTITTLEGYKDLLIYPPSVLIEGEDENDKTDDK